jgi:hypothetical protein
MATTDITPVERQEPGIEQLLLEASKRRTNAEQREAELRTKLEVASASRRFWADLISFLEKDWPMHVRRLVDDMTSKAGVHACEDDPVLIAIREDADRKANRILRRFPAQLESAAHEANLPLDPQSRHPRYTFANGALQFDVDERKGVARLKGREGRLGEVPADIGAVVELVKKEHERLFGRRFQPKQFLKKIRMQYLAAAKAADQADGASIPVREVLKRVARKEKGVRVDELLVDLSRLVEDGSLEIDGRRLDLQQTKDTREGILLFGNAGRGYIGYITFTKA